MTPASHIPCHTVEEPPQGSEIEVRGGEDERLLTLDGSGHLLVIDVPVRDGAARSSLLTPAQAP